MWRDAIDFLKLHYVLNDRPEPFWVANRMTQSIPQSLQDNLRLWQNRAPIAGDFPQTAQLFGPASYQYILYGMGHRHRPDASTQVKPSADTVAQSLAEVKAQAARLTRLLAPNRDVICQARA